MTKKMMLLAMAVAAIAFAVPAGASASGHFLHNEGPLEGEIEEGLEGTLSFTTAIGTGMACDAHPVLHLTTNGGTVTDLGLTTETCVGQGFFAGCTLSAHEIHGGNSVTPTSDAIHINDLVLTNTYAGPCALGGSSSTLTFNVVATPNNPKSITSLTLAGPGTAHTAFGSLGATASGALEADNPGTIGLG
jgi:hypothetical protein